MGNQWPFLRVFYLLFSLAVLSAAAYYEFNIFLLILGGGFFIQALLGVGCSPGGYPPKGYRNKFRRR